MPAPVSPLPLLRWQFPAEDPSYRGAGPFRVTRTFALTPDTLPLLPAPLSLPPSGDKGRSLAIFAIEPSIPTEGAGTWHVSLTFALAGPGDEDEPRATEENAQAAMLSLAARLWAKCYLTSATPAQSNLCKVLGAGVLFDGLVARHFLMHHAIHGLDDLVQHALKAAAKEGDEWAAVPAAQGRLLAEVRGALDDIRSALLGEGSTFAADAQEQEMPAWDARLASWIEQLGAKAIAQDVRDRGHAAAAAGGLAFWEKWLPTPALPPLRRLTFAAFALWRVRVRPLLEREAQSKPLRIETIAYAGDSYTPVPKLAAPVSWAFGAPGAPVAEVAGDRYAQEPSFIEDAALLPRSWRLLPEDHERRPHQTALALDEGRSDALPVAIAGSQAYVLSPYAAKLALLMLASNQLRTGQIACSTLGQLTRMTRPDTKRLQARDHEATARGLDELNHLFIFLPDNTKVPVFLVLQSPAKPELAKPEMELHYGLNPIFLTALARAASGNLRGRRLSGHEYSGSFLLNLTGAMRLPNNQPTLLRYYLRFAAHWNAAFVPGSGGEFDPSRMPARAVEEWAALANALPPSVVDYLAARRSGKDTDADRRRQLSLERKRAHADLAALAEEHGLLRLEKQGDQIKPLPPPAYLEAWRLMRAEGGRPENPLGED